MLTVKMDHRLENELVTASKTVGVSKSEFVRQALHVAILQLKNQKALTPYELGKDLFGQVRSGVKNLSSQRARNLIVRQKREKDTHR